MAKKYNGYEVISRPLGIDQYWGNYSDALRAYMNCKNHGVSVTLYGISAAGYKVIKSC